MLYIKNIKKYSHCQYLESSLKTNRGGFFTLEFVYTFCVVTLFIGVISLYISLSIGWQGLVSNHLIALNDARTSIEQQLIDGVSPGDFFEPDNKHYVVTINKHEYPMPAYLPRFEHNELAIKSIEVLVVWNDDRGNSHAVQLQTYT